ncbi:MAG: SDR family oxidoreductase [Thermodesulfobacteriota bacterium]|jgi:NAD(P)-dependent dehydrogenase (short-subunit alcohol dehydrogenase family)
MHTVLITGASSGIGLATAEYLVQKGFQVFGTTRSLEKRAAAVQAAKQRCGDCLQWVEMDVTKEDSVERAVKQVEAKAGGIDGLVCNAGIGIYGSIEETPIDQVFSQFDTNVFGYLRTLRAVLPGMRERRSGKIVLISSMAGILAIPYQVHYSAAKYAVEAFTEGLRQELRNFNIKVSAVRPGDIATEFNDATLLTMPENSPYTKWSKPCWKTIEKNMVAAPKPILVAKLIYRILKKKNPKAFYTAADFLTSLTPILTPFMSSQLKEKVVRMFYGIDSK